MFSQLCQFVHPYSFLPATHHTTPHRLVAWGAVTAGSFVARAQLGCCWLGSGMPLFQWLADQRRSTIILLPCMYHWVTQQCRNYLAYFATGRPASRLLCNVQGHASSHNNELKGRKTNKHTYVCTNLQTKISFEKIFILLLLSS